MSLLDIKLPKAVKVNIDGKEVMVYPVDHVDEFTAQVTQAMIKLVQDSKVQLATLNAGIDNQSMQLSVLHQNYAAYAGAVHGFQKLIPILRSNPDKRVQAYLPDFDAILSRLAAQLAQ